MILAEIRDALVVLITVEVVGFAHTSEAAKAKDAMQYSADTGVLAETAFSNGLPNTGLTMDPEASSVETYRGDLVLDVDTSSSTDSDDDSGGNDADNGSSVVGIVCGVAAAFMAICIIGSLVMYRRQKVKKKGA
ncbi:hypothetical protein CYMTET_55048 [Cymbomonas tetramitiformis]|uniref:Uncharacterized protein n=1 Tax=Cymbomonas tetramitiformis TaxID=36881 RepID=A0AAE0BDQ1_9CHLO|nr:hypothetical protein CYMTET_55048 [Cymbomonas tetramitiformis]